MYRIQGRGEAIEEWMQKGQLLFISSAEYYTSRYKMSGQQTGLPIARQTSQARAHGGKY